MFEKFFFEKRHGSARYFLNNDGTPFMVSYNWNDGDGEFINNETGCTYYKYNVIGDCFVTRRGEKIPVVVTTEEKYENYQNKLIEKKKKAEKEEYENKLKKILEYKNQENENFLILKSFFLKVVPNFKHLRTKNQFGSYEYDFDNYKFYVNLEEQNLWIKKGKNCAFPNNYETEQIIKTFTNHFFYKTEDSSDFLINLKTFLENN